MLDKNALASQVYMKQWGYSREMAKKEKTRTISKQKGWVLDGGVG